MDRTNKKRSYTAMSQAKRVPLAEANQNVPLPASIKPRVKNVPVASNVAKVEREDDSVAIAKRTEVLAVGEKLASREAEETTSVATEHLVKKLRKIEDSKAAGGGPASKSARLVGDELKSWQESWRKIMKESVVYFDTQGCDSNNLAQQQEQKRAQRALRLVGCEIVPFYDRDVSIIVSRRQFNSSKAYPNNDIFHDAVSLKIKVWDYDKVFRFLKNLGVSDSASQERTGNLSNLLKEEKIFGSADKDPNAKREDLHYLEKNFIYVYDLSQAVRPIAVREWSGENYPSFYYTLDGKCPFIPDTSDNLERKKLRRLQKFEATKEYRELLKKVTDAIIGHARDSFSINSSAVTETSTSTDSAGATDSIAEDDATNDREGTVDDNDNDTILMEKKASSEPDEDTEGKENFDFKAPAALTRNSSVMQPFNNSVSQSNSRFYDVVASGYNGASNAQSISMDSVLNSAAQQHAHQGNGLGPTVSQVVSKNLNNLKRRIFLKKHMQKADSRERERERELKPGYCENCRVKYDSFDEHIVSNRHRNFACNDENFKEIDDLIATLNESKFMGYVASNGDYNYE